MKKNKTVRPKAAKATKTSGPSPREHGFGPGGVPVARDAPIDEAAFIPNPEQTHRRVRDDFAEYLGEAFVQGATGNDVDADAQDAVLPEEVGGPWVETDAATEFGSTMTQAAQSDDEPTLTEAFPTAVRADADASLLDEATADDDEEEEDLSENFREPVLHAPAAPGMHTGPERGRHIPRR